MRVAGIGGRSLELVTGLPIPMAADRGETSKAAIGARLTMTRDIIGESQGEFARKAKIASNTYNQYEQGKKRPSLDNAIRLCETYDLTLDWIYRGDPSGLHYRMADAIKAVRKARH